jgi:aspartyl-tRNA(Asn)/glutamyl-tRNA(Gln) amidotransferase subunit A
VPDYEAALAGPVRGLRVGVPETYYFDRVRADVAAAVRAAVDVLAGLGVRPVPLALPDPTLLLDVAQIVARAESAVLHARVLRERPHELGPAVRVRLAVGTRVSAHDYLQALRLRARLLRQFLDAVFGEVDVLVAPVIPEPAPALAAVTAGTAEEVAARMGDFSRLTRPFNVLGLPALAVPCGLAGEGLPLAFQVVGRPFEEATVLRLGHAYQQATDWHRREPPGGP